METQDSLHVWTYVQPQVARKHWKVKAVSKITVIR